MNLILGVPKEIIGGEKRVGIVPESLAKLSSLGFEIRVEKDAGKEAGFLDSDYEAHGAKIVSSASELYSAADVVVKVERPEQHPEAGKHELEMLKKGALLICFMAYAC